MFLVAKSGWWPQLAPNAPPALFLEPVFALFATPVRLCFELSLAVLHEFDQEMVSPDPALRGWKVLHKVDVNILCTILQCRRATTARCKMCASALRQFPPLARSDYRRSGTASAVISLISH
jgi:hypothetical protein